jgi:hypothetical protein
MPAPTLSEKNSPGSLEMHIDDCCIARKFRFFYDAPFGMAKIAAHIASAHNTPNTAQTTTHQKVSDWSLKEGKNCFSREYLAHHHHKKYSRRRHTLNCSTSSIIHHHLSSRILLHHFLAPRYRPFVRI